MAVETREQAMDLVACIFARAGARLAAEVRHEIKDAGVLEPPDINEVGLAALKAVKR